MDPLCFMCDHAATKVCIHKHCKDPAYFCEGPCIKNAGARIHAHCGQQHTAQIDLGRLEQRVAKIKSRLGDNQDQEHFDQVKKKVIIIKEDLDRMVQIHEKELREKQQLRLKSEIQDVISKIQIRGGEDTPPGLKLSLLFGDNEDIYQEYTLANNPITWIKREMLRVLQVVEKEIQDKCKEFSETIAESEAQIEEANELYEEGKWMQALDLFQRAQTTNIYNPQISKMAQCCFALGQTKEASIYAQRLLKRNDTSPVAYKILADAHSKSLRHEEALSCYSQLIQLGPPTSLLYTQRAQCLTDLNRHKLAAADYVEAIKLDPSDELYRKLNTCINNITNNLKVPSNQQTFVTTAPLLFPTTFPHNPKLKNLKGYN